MILPGRTVLARGILRGISAPSNQVQPCGIDLSLRRVLRWTTPGVIDFDNKFRKAASTIEIPFELPSNNIHLKQGSYLVEFNETVDTPLDAMGQIFVRSSLFRSGAMISAGVMDSGYSGAVGMSEVGFWFLRCLTTFPKGHCYRLLTSTDSFYTEMQSSPSLFFTR